MNLIGQYDGSFMRRISNARFPEREVNHDRHSKLQFRAKHAHSGALIFPVGHRRSCLAACSAFFPGHRLCCTNLVTLGRPLSPDRPILRPLCWVPLGR
jgi:hypothetical protein